MHARPSPEGYSGVKEGNIFNVAHIIHFITWPAPCFLTQERFLLYPSITLAYHPMPFHNIALPNVRA